MVARAHRISRGADFQRLFSRGNRVHLPALTLVSARNGNKDTRYAVVVGLTVTKRANVRNLLRRRLSEYLRRTLPTIASGYDCVFVVRPPAVKAAREAMRDAAAILLRRAGLLPPHQP
ncbi:MAG: ribonuclease P protein component [bacterium]|nr:ribonuclease P protein component [bacterium]